jgi:hypothetical protein
MGKSDAFKDLIINIHSFSSMSLAELFSLYNPSEKPLDHKQDIPHPMHSFAIRL